MNPYNVERVPILAPAGFPARLALPPVDSAFFVPELKRVQRELGLTPDGLCGPQTVRAIGRAEYRCAHQSDPDGGWIMCGPRALRTGARVRTYLDPDHAWLDDTVSATRTQHLTLGVVHYDVTNSAEATHRVLLARELSTHFMIDADGTLYQCHDPATVACRHAGTAANRASVGVDLNNPALREYERSARPRPEVRAQVHGTTRALLDYWPEQIEALRALMGALEEGLGLPRVCPRDARGAPITTTIARAAQHHGWIGHYHITATKMDPAPLRWDDVCPRSMG